MYISKAWRYKRTGKWLKDAGSDDRNMRETEGGREARKVEERWIRGRAQSEDAMIREGDMGNDEKEIKDKESESSMRGEGVSDCWRRDGKEEDDR